MMVRFDIKIITIIIRMVKMDIRIVKMTKIIAPSKNRKYPVPFEVFNIFRMAPIFRRKKYQLWQMPNREP